MTTATTTFPTAGAYPEGERAQTSTLYPEYDKTASKAASAFEKGIAHVAGSIAETVSGTLQHIDPFIAGMKGMNTASEKLSEHKNNTSGWIKDAITFVQEKGLEPVLGAFINIMETRVALHDKTQDKLNQAFGSAFPGIPGAILQGWNRGGDNMGNITQQVSQERDARLNN